MTDDMQDLKVSIAEIKVTVEHMSKSIERLEKILETVNTHATRIDALEMRVKSLEDGRSWVIRVVGAVIITALLGLVVIKTGMPIPMK